jgi:protoheme IX farnesyltransferase
LSIQERHQTVIQTGIRTETSLIKVAVQLFKLRIVTLLLFASLGGAFMGAGGFPTVGQLVVLLVAGGFGAAGASALNQYIERHSDGNMKRTSQRPLVNGTITNAEIVLAIALTMVLAPVALLWPSNPEMAFFILLGAFIYVVVYTIWLKPRTILNIVIGGAAGSCAVLSGGAAVGNWNDPGVLVLAIILFLWTPTHFWSLAIMVRDDYIAADVPMLPAKTSNRDAAIWAFVHAVSVGFATLLLVLHPAMGWLYFVPAAWMTYHFIKHSWRLIQTPERDQAKTLFLTSNGYLALILLSVCVAAVVGV